MHVYKHMLKNVLLRKGHAINSIPKSVLCMQVSNCTHDGGKSLNAPVSVPCLSRLTGMAFMIVFCGGCLVWHGDIMV